MLTADQIANLSPEKRKEVEEALRALEKLKQQDPIQFFHCCPTRCDVPGCEPHPRQHEFMAAGTKTRAVFAGNRFGKTTAAVVLAFIQHYPLEQLPERLRQYKRITHDRPVKGRWMCPSADVLEGYGVPKMKEWLPRPLLLGGTWEKAYSKQHQTLHFKDGGLIEFRTYMMDADKLIGADLDYVIYDEPPPEEHRKENYPRLLDRKGFEAFALTPVNMKGGGIGWLYRDIFKKREAPDITVVQGSIHDNVRLDRAEIEQTLSIYDAEERRAREFGEFVNFGGMVFSGGFERCLMNRAPRRDEVKEWDIVVGMDPGLKNAAFTWIGFDNENRAYVFDEVRLQEKTPRDYAVAIRATNAKWGIRDPLYVIDPSARNRSLINAESVEAVLQSEGIFAMHGMNAVEAGIQQMRLRIEHGMFYVSPECRILRDEAEEYRMQDRPDGEFKIVKERDHQIDSTRYGVTTRLWAPDLFSPEVQQPLGWQPGRAMSAQQMQVALRNRPVEGNPLGSMA